MSRVPLPPRRLSLPRRLLRWAYLIAATITTGLLVLFNARLYTPVPAPTATDEIVADVTPQLRYLGDRLRDGAGEEMQAYFPEGYFFSHALYGLAAADVGLRLPADSDLGREMRERAAWALARLESPEGRRVFDAGLRPAHGIFYAGWTTYLRGRLLRLDRLQGRAGDEAGYTRACEEIAAAFAASETPFLQAYPNQTWPCDSTVAVAALGQHDELLGPRFAPVVGRWVTQARGRLDPATGLLPHQVDPITGQPLAGARGSSQSVIHRFLPDVDPAFAREQYAAFRTRFVDTLAGLPGVREHPLGTDGGGDVDSGPLIFGVSASATVVTIGAARVHGDDDLARRLWQVGEAAGCHVTLNGRKRYAGGLLPVGDAFVAWAKSAGVRPAVAGADRPAVVGAGWRVPTHGVCAVVVAVAWSPWWVRRLRRRRSGGRPRARDR
ncbi:MAG TPA: hypothetical protein VF796_27870 [Humisphaera sp.]